MNIGRVVGAGLLAGLLLNVGEAALHGVLYADATAAAMRALEHEVVGTGLPPAFASDSSFGLCPAFTRPST